MPSLAIHLAIAKRYTELHPHKITSLSDFQKGSIAPDLNSDFSRILSKPEKMITHYYNQSGEYITNFNLFKQDKRIDFANDYWKGYYAHLLTDYLFYSISFKQETNLSSKDDNGFYNDFTILTSRIIKNYHPIVDNSYLTDVIKHCLITKDGDCKYLEYTKVHSFIEKTAIELDQAIQSIL